MVKGLEEVPRGRIEDGVRAAYRWELTATIEQAAHEHFGAAAQKDQEPRLVPWPDASELLVGKTVPGAAVILEPDLRHRPHRAMSGQVNNGAVGMRH